MTFNYHGLYYDLQLNTSILFSCRHSQCFHKLVFLSSKPTDMRNTVYIEVKSLLRILFERTNRTISLEVLVELTRIEFSFYPDLLELAQSSDYPIIKAQTFTKELYCRYQLLHIRKVASDKICKLRQLTVLLLVSVSYFLYLFGLLLFPLSGFLFKFKYAVLQILVPAFQRFLLSTSGKRTHTFGYVGRCGSGCAFQFLGLYFFLGSFEFLFGFGFLPGFLFLQPFVFHIKGIVLFLHIPLFFALYTFPFCHRNDIDVKIISAILQFFRGYSSIFRNFVMSFSTQFCNNHHHIQTSHLAIIIYNFSSMNKKERTISFLWQHLWLLVSLFIMTLGVAVCVKSELGSSVISTLPYVFETAGKRGLGVPSLTIGQYTYIMNAILVAGQIAVLRRRFEPVQLFQLLVGFVFGSLIDLNMALTSWLLPDDITEQALAQIAGCTVLGIGIALEVRCGSVTMPGEGFPVAVSCVTGIDFPKIKIVVDCSLVVLAVAFCYVFFGAWQWYIVGVGTLFAMLYVGIVVKIAGRHMAWFDKILNYRPGFRRYVYGLAKLIFRQKQ